MLCLTVSRASVALAAAAGFAFLSAIAGQALAQSAADDPVVATVNNVEIHRSDLAIAAEDVGSTNPGKTEQAKNDYLINYLSDMILFAKAAEDENIVTDSDVARRLMFVRKKTLMERMLARIAATAASEDAVRKAYDEAVKQITAEQEVHARHILFRVTDQKDAAASAAAEAKAKAALARIRKGEDFSVVAQELTEDPAGKQNGGDLGYFAKAQMVPEFTDVAFRLEKGEVSDPIKTMFGWHIINVLDKRARQAPEFDKVRPRLEAYVVHKAQADMIAKLRKGASIERQPNPPPSDPNK